MYRKHTYVHTYIRTYGLGSRAARPQPRPLHGIPAWPSPKRVGATILVTVLVFGIWDRHRDVKLLQVAGIGPFGVAFRPR